MTAPDRTDPSSWCAAIRAEQQEPIFASAPEVISTWLLVEHPGPWPSRGFPGDLSNLARGVLEAAEERGVRVQFIRRVRDRRRAGRTIVVAGRGGARGWAETRDAADLDELAELDLATLADGVAPGFGAAVDPSEPVVLVCTHGRRDVCCARLGRPVAVALSAAMPGRVWETTHVGGDRFAANVVTLPGGQYHGGLTAADVERVAAAITAGELDLERWRGECGVPAAQQAAAYFLRRELAEARIDAVRVLGAADAPGEERVVRIAVDGRPEHLVRVRRVGNAPRRTSCAHGGTIGAPASYELVSLSASSGSVGTTIGIPDTGSGIVTQSTPNTAETVSGVMTSAGDPEA
ncbi:sucrase ferredoxin [Microbacterium sp. MEC084]|nr:sucrase ferredoxin [Microbacterium sp. MEC084]